MLFSIYEIFDIIVTVFALGFIFSGFFDRFSRNNHTDDVIAQYTKKRSFFNWESIKFAALLIGPAVILHELGHKFVGMYYGFSATYHAAYIFLVLGIVLKILNWGIIIAPAFIQIVGNGTPLQYALVALAGPAVNMILWLGSRFIVKNSLVDQKYLPYFAISARINLFLFGFNMIPIPGFDGFQFFRGIFLAFS